jgi:hypothetical protein
MTENPESKKDEASKLWKYMPQMPGVPEFAKEGPHDEERYDQSTFLWTGIFVCVMLVVIPVWDGVALRNDPVWRWMYGSFWWTNYLLCFAAFPILFALTALCAFKYTYARQKKNSTGLSMMVQMHVIILLMLVLGTALVGVGNPVVKLAQKASDVLYFECSSNPMTLPLYVEYTSLRTLRDQPDCTGLPSIEECNGYNETSKSKTLKEFEEYFGCGGFCYYPPADLVLTSSTNSTSTPETQAMVGKKQKMENGEKLLQDIEQRLSHFQAQLKQYPADSSKRDQIQLKIEFLIDQKKHYNGLIAGLSVSGAGNSANEGNSTNEVSLMRLREALRALESLGERPLDASLLQVSSKASESNGSTNSSVPNSSVPSSSSYPQPLFYPVALAGSCSSMAGRDMSSFIKDIGNQLQIEGMFLISVSIILGFIHMLRIMSVGPFEYMLRIGGVRKRQSKDTENTYAAYYGAIPEIDTPDDRVPRPVRYRVR